MNFSKIDWSVFKKYTSAQAVKDLDSFLDALPINVGYNALAAAGIAWIVGGAAVVFAAMETEKVTKLHASLMEVQALQPPVPVLKYVPVSQASLKSVTKKITDTYKGVALLVNRDGEVTISAQDVDYFPQFLASISYLQRGGKNWKVKINTFCAGRACTGSSLSTNLKVDMVRMGEPEIKKEEDKKEKKK